MPRPLANQRRLVLKPFKLLGSEHRIKLREVLLMLASLTQVVHEARQVGIAKELDKKHKAP